MPRGVSPWTVPPTPASPPASCCVHGWDSAWKAPEASEGSKPEAFGKSLLGTRQQEHRPWGMHAAHSRNSRGGRSGERRRAKPEWVTYLSGVGGRGRPHRRQPEMGMVRQVCGCRVGPHKADTRWALAVRANRVGKGGEGQMRDSCGARWWC